MYLAKTEHWTKGKPEIQALLSAYLVMLCDGWFNHVYSFNADKEFKPFQKIIDLNEWTKCYFEFFDNSNAITQASKGILPNDKFAEILSIQDDVYVKEFMTASKEKKVEQLKQVLLNNFETYEFQNKTTEEDLIKNVKLYFETVQIIFLYRVVLPSVLIYHKTPQLLLREAIKGDFNACRNLLRLDKNILNVPEFRKIWEQESRNPKSARFKSLAKAFQESAYENISPTKIKILFATAIELIFKLSGHNITRAEIKELFDAYAADTQNTRFDQDLPKYLDAFSRAINRQLKVLVQIYTELQGKIAVSPLKSIR